MQVAVAMSAMPPTMADHPAVPMGAMVVVPMMMVPMPVVPMAMVPMTMLDRLHQAVLDDAGLRDDHGQGRCICSSSAKAEHCHSKKHRKDFSHLTALLWMNSPGTPCQDGGRTMNGG